MVLMLIGPGSAILAKSEIGVYGVAFAFGLALLVMSYAIGHVSGCHINPAVTLGFWAARKITIVQAAWYWVAQLAGAIIGGLIIYIISDNGRLDTTTNNTGHHIFAANGWGDKIGGRFGLGPVVAVEIVFTALFVFVVLTTTTNGFPAGFAGLAAGLTLAMIHLATIPVDNTSVNPARSVGTAIFSGSDARSQLWAFLIWPLVGAAAGVATWLLVFDKTSRPT